MISPMQKTTLESFFQNEPVEVVYLYGSYAIGKNHPKSDVDIGVLFEDKISINDRFEKILDYQSRFDKLFHPLSVDIVDLNSADVFLRYSAFAPRQEICIKNNKNRINFETQTLTQYFDRLPYLKRHTNQSLASIARKGIL